MTEKEVKQGPDLRGLPFQRRRAMVAAYLQEHGVDLRGVPMDMGTHIAIPKVQFVDMWETDDAQRRAGAARDGQEST